jgi:hemoglobin
MARTIFERYGGFAKVNRIVSAFYDKILESPVTSPYFENVDMRRLIDHQTKFVATVMGGPASYTNDQLDHIHAHLEVTDRAFDQMALLLKETLEDFDMADEDVQFVYDEIVSRKRFVVSRAAGVGGVR